MKKIKVQPATESVPVYEFRQYVNRSMQINGNWYVKEGK